MSYTDMVLYRRGRWSCRLSFIERLFLYNSLAKLKLLRRGTFPVKALLNHLCPALNNFPVKVIRRNCRLEITTSNMIRVKDSCIYKRSPKDTRVISWRRLKDVLCLPNTTFSPIVIILLIHDRIIERYDYTSRISNYKKFQTLRHTGV